MSADGGSPLDRLRATGQRSRSRLRCGHLGDGGLRHCVPVRLGRAAGRHYTCRNPTILRSGVGGVEHFRQRNVGRDTGAGHDVGQVHRPTRRRDGSDDFGGATSGVHLTFDGVQPVGVDGDAGVDEPAGQAGEAASA